MIKKNKTRKLFYATSETLRLPSVTDFILVPHLPVVNDFSLLSENRVPVLEMSIPLGMIPSMWAKFWQDFVRHLPNYY